MAFFKEVYCKHCGKKTNIITRVHLEDDNYLCFECTSHIPSFMHLEQRDYEGYLEVSKYIKETSTNLEKKFHETIAFKDIHADTEHGIFYIDIDFGTTVYFKMSKILEFDLVYSANKLKEGLTGDYVIGKILFKVKLKDPDLYYEKIISKEAKGKAKKSFFGSKIEYENPKGMDEFLLRFNSACQRFIEEEENSDYSNYSSQSYQSQLDQLEQARILFMIDDLSMITLEELKKQRNRLIQIYHPDKGTVDNGKYAQKINVAYDILLDYLRNR